MEKRFDPAAKSTCFYVSKNRTMEELEALRFTISHSRVIREAEASLRNVLSKSCLI